MYLLRILRPCAITFVEYEPHKSEFLYSRWPRPPLEAIDNITYVRNPERILGDNAERIWFELKEILVNLPACTVGCTRGRGGGDVLRKYFVTSVKPSLSRKFLLLFFIFVFFCLRKPSAGKSNDYMTLSCSKKSLFKTFSVHVHENEQSAFSNSDWRAFCEKLRCGDGSVWTGLAEEIKLRFRIPTS